MPKHLVTAIGLVVSIGVIALGFAFVALPLYFQAANVDVQTATIANMNASYQAQVDNLRVQEQNLDEINAEVAALRAQIPTSGQFDDVFEVIGRAAAASGVTLTSVTAGDPVAFVVRTGTSSEVPAADGSAGTDTTETDGAATDGTETGTGTDAGSSTAVDDRLQVDFVIHATAADMGEATAFLDRLRAGPRLLNSVAANTSENGSRVDVQITALTYIAPEG